MIDGFYSIAFTGGAGSGVGVLTLHRGIVAGADAGGANYDGRYVERASGSGIEIEVVMRAPAGLIPVQTGIPLTADVELPIAAVLPNDFASARAVRLDTPLGPVNVAFKKIRDYPV